jgi:hypothetical protein
MPRTVPRTTAKRTASAKRRPPSIKPASIKPATKQLREARVGARQVTHNVKETFERAMKGEIMVVTKHGHEQVVILDWSKYVALTGRAVA